MSMIVIWSGRQSTSTTNENMETVKEMILDNRRITIKQVADDVGKSFGSCQAIFTNVLDMKRALAKIVSKLLILTKNNVRMDIAQELLTTFKDDLDLLKKCITGEESCLFFFSGGEKIIERHCCSATVV